MPLAYTEWAPRVVILFRFFQIHNSTSYSQFMNFYTDINCQSVDNNHNQTPDSNSLVKYNCKLSCDALHHCKFHFSLYESSRLFCTSHGWQYAEIHSSHNMILPKLSTVTDQDRSVPYRVLGKSEEILVLFDSWATVRIGMTLVQIHVPFTFVWITLESNGHFDQCLHVLQEFGGA